MVSGLPRDVESGWRVWSEPVVAGLGSADVMRARTSVPYICQRGAGPATGPSGVEGASGRTGTWPLSPESL